MKTIEKELHKVVRVKGWMSCFKEISKINQEAVVLTGKIQKVNKIALILITKKRKIL